MKTIKSKKWEILGLILLLVSFAWQCFEEQSNSARIEQEIYDFQERFFDVLSMEFDAAKFHNNYDSVLVGIDYDSTWKRILDWDNKRNEESMMAKRARLFFWIRAVLYVFGSIFIIWSKTMELKCNKNNRPVQIDSNSSAVQ